jgi:putative addiction module component (TIGR02574 family)
MSDVPIPPSIRNLSVADRVELVTRIWESVAEDTATVGLSDEHKRILDERVREANENPESLIPADEVFRDLMEDR